MSGIQNLKLSDKNLLCYELKIRKTELNVKKNRPNSRLLIKIKHASPNRLLVGFRKKFSGQGLGGQTIVINYFIPFLLRSFFQPLQNGGKGKSIKIGYNKISEKVQESLIPQIMKRLHGLY